MSRDQDGEDHAGSRSEPAGKGISKDALRAPLPKRFYKQACAAPAEGGFGIELDGRPVRTPGKRLLVVASQPLAQAIATEWSQQGNEIDPATMPLTRIVNSALDAVAVHAGAVAGDIGQFAGSDLLLYRAESPVELVARQASAWNPVIAWARGRLGADLRVTSGVMPVAQSETVIGAVSRLAEKAGPLRLAALHVMTTLTGSALLALAHAEGLLGWEEAWTAAHIDEDWQIEQWGEDGEAADRRAARRREFEAASRIYHLSAPCA